MKVTPMYPLTDEERASVKRLLDERPLDWRFLSVLANRGWTTKAELQGQEPDPELHRAVFRWLGSAQRRGLLDQREAGKELQWRITDAGRARRDALAYDPEINGIADGVRHRHRRMFGRRLG